MAKTSATTMRRKPENAGLITLHVLRRARLSPSFVRVTLGGGEIASFAPLGFDQWFRLFLPVSQDSLARLPNKLDTLSYLRYLAIAKTDRPVLRNYSVAGYRAGGADGAELDVDFVLHGEAAAAGSGPAARWAQTCAPGDTVALLDEGLLFAPPAPVRHVQLVADETGLPAAASILTDLPRDTVGRAVLEVPRADDRRAIDAPVGVEVHWVVRDDPHRTPGFAALAAATAAPVPTEPFAGWVVGEQALPVGVRRHWVRAGVPKDAISFCGYWKAAAH